MAATSDIISAGLGGGGWIELRPPVGEIWQVTRIDSTRGSATIPARIDYRTATNYGMWLYNQGGEYFLGPLWLTNAAYLRASNGDAGTNAMVTFYVLKYAAADVPMRVSATDLVAGGIVEFRPPVGTDWMGKSLFTAANVAASYATLAFKNATAEATGPLIAYNGAVQATAQGRHGAGVSLFMTNTFWVKITTTSACAVMLAYSEMQAGALTQVAGLQALSATGVADIRPPAGEVWTIGAWYCGDTTARFNPNPGTGYIVTDNTSPYLKAGAVLSNAKYATITGPAAATAAWLGWKHPL